MLIYVDLTNTA